MKFVALLFGLLGLVSLPAAAAGLTVTVSGIDQAARAGLVLYSSRVSYPKAPRQTEFAAVSNGIAQFHFDDLAPGDYALMTWADANDDGEFDRSMFGNPKEAYVYSNDVHSAEPDWDSVRFTLGGQALELQVTVAQP